MLNEFPPLASFTTPTATVLFAAFSKLNPQREMETSRNVFQFSVKYAAFLDVPAATAAVALSQPAISTLSGEKHKYAPLFLILIAISYMCSALGSPSLEKLLNGQGETKVTPKPTLITTIGLPSSLLLIPKLGITGLIATNLATGIPSLIIGLSWIKKHYGTTSSGPHQQKYSFHPQQPPPSPT